MKRLPGRSLPMMAMAGVAALAFPGAAAQANDCESDGMQHVSRTHDRLRAARGRECETLKQLYDKDIYGGWVAFKKSINDKLNLEFSMDASLMGQWGSSGAGPGAGQGLLTPSANWTLFERSSVGTGEIQIAYSFARYLGSRNGADLQSGLNLNTPVNDFPSNSHAFSQLSYTHSFPGDRIAVTLGQFPIYNFDGNNYAANQQVNFINYSMTQNGSSTYPGASLGAYVQVNPTKEIAIVSGFQDANNVSGSGIHTGTFGDGEYTWFLYGSWSPTIKSLGQAQISLLYYNQPSVPAQPQATTGWSLNATQEIGQKWGLFLRANTASSGTVANIRTSITGGGVLNNPLGRNPLDQIGLGLGWNKVNKALYADQDVRSSETVLEAYWAYTLLDGLQLTPDVQLTPKPALDRSKDLSAVFTLRGTLLF